MEGPPPIEYDDNPEIHRLRGGAIALSAACAVIYLIIGARLVTVVEGDPGGQGAFGLTAAVGFGAGAAALWRFDGRRVWTLGAIGVAFVIFTYFDLASERVPDFELWGLLLRALQLPLLVILVILATRTWAAIKLEDRPVS